MCIVSFQRMRAIWAVSALYWVGQSTIYTYIPYMLHVDCRFKRHKVCYSERRKREKKQTTHRDRCVSGISVSHCRTKWNDSCYLSFFSLFVSLSIVECRCVSLVAQMHRDRFKCATDKNIVSSTTTRAIATTEANIQQWTCEPIDDRMVGVSGME